MKKESEIGREREKGEDVNRSIVVVSSSPHTVSVSECVDERKKEHACVSWKYQSFTKSQKPFQLNIISCGLFFAVIWNFFTPSQLN